MILKDEWIHIAIRHDRIDICAGLIDTLTFSKTNYQFYKNGEISSVNSCSLPTNNMGGSCPTNYPLPPNNNFPQNPFPLNPSMALGISQNGNSHFKGLIDDVRIYIGVGSNTSDSLLIDSLFNNPPQSTTGLFEHQQSKKKFQPIPTHQIVELLTFKPL